MTPQENALFRSLAKRAGLRRSQYLITLMREEDLMLRGASPEAFQLRYDVWGDEHETLIERVVRLGARKAEAREAETRAKRPFKAMAAALAHVRQAHAERAEKEGISANQPCKPSEPSEPSKPNEP